MEFQQRTADLLQKQAEAVCRSAQALPKDKHEWVPTGAALNLKDQLKMLATVPIFQIGEAPVITEDQKSRIAERKMALDTFDKLIEGAIEAARMTADATREVPDSKLEDVMTLHSRGGVKRTMCEMVARPYWNLCYHEGQINYIQVLLGDTEMH